MYQIIYADCLAGDADGGVLLVPVGGEASVPFLGRAELGNFLEEPDLCAGCRTAVDEFFLIRGIHSLFKQRQPGCLAGHIHSNRSLWPLTLDTI